MSEQVTSTSRSVRISSEYIEAAQAGLKKSLDNLTGADLEEINEKWAEDLREEIEQHQKEINEEWIKTLKDR